MKTLTKKLLPVIAMTVALFASTQANAAMVVYDNSDASVANDFGNPFTFSYTTDKGKEWTLKFGFSGFSSPVVDKIAVGSDFADQSWANVSDVVEQTFGVSPFSQATGTEGVWASGPLTGGITGASYDYLAVHFGGYEVFFHFTGLVAANQTFNIDVYKPETNPGGGLSNWRTFNSNPSAVPVPAAVWLFGSALLGLTGASRRKKTHTAVVSA